MVQVVSPEEGALHKPSKRSERLQERLRRMRTVNEEEYASRVASKADLPYVDLHLTSLSAEDVYAIAENTARALEVVSFSRRGKTLRLGTPHPDNPDLLTFIERITQEQGWTVELYVLSLSSLERGFRLYKNVYLVDLMRNLKLSLDAGDIAGFEDDIARMEKLSTQPDALSTTEILNTIFSGAIFFGASDIHIEPQSSGIRLRYRIDGVLQDVVELPYAVYKTIVARIKLMSSMKINVDEIAQDGRFSFTVGEKKVDVRASTMPTKKAEGIVLRILSNDGIAQSLESIGITGKSYKDLKNALTKNDGVILTTGPTGSGKTTTLYTIINHINDPGTKVITVENPIEYDMDGIVQTEVARAEGYTFAKALRSIVRQDPDVILVGEIRDEETADVAVNAALTGHLVLSTLHTNNAPATVARLMELGVRPNLIPPATNIFLAQRLVRRLCECKQEHQPAEAVAEHIMNMLALISPKAELDVPTEVTTLYKPGSCAKCHGSGYKGRVGIFETLTITESIEEHIINLSGEAAITKSAIEDGYITMAQDGLIKAVQGLTSIEEVWRVTSESDILTELHEDLMMRSLGKRVHVSRDQQELAKTSSVSLASVDQSIKTQDSKDLLSMVLASAISLGASDIHIEPAESMVELRVRIDGVLQKVGEVSVVQYQHILSHIKNVSGIPTTVRQGVVDSRFGVLLESESDDLDGEKVDVRVSIIVGGFGEMAVLRILHQDVITYDLEQLGITAYNMERMTGAATKPYGLVLSTGPTGSGKTTTLYSLLNKLNNEQVKIITVEDPIEYQLNGVLQTQVDKESNYTFTTALRALLRQDPDVLLVGEIRDAETAEIAMSASLTGHLLISTLHTNNAVGALQRLLNLGVRSTDITSSLNAVMAQRLVRKLCDCKVTKEVTPEEGAHIQSVLDGITPRYPEQKPPVTLYSPGSCQECNGIGYKGRVVVSEVLVCDDDIKALIVRGALPSEIAEVAVKNGMLTMEQDGVLKALAGETTLDEVQRVTMV